MTGRSTGYRLTEHRPRGHGHLYTRRAAAAVVNWKREEKLPSSHGHAESSLGAKRSKQVNNLTVTILQERAISPFVRSLVGCLVLLRVITGKGPPEAQSSSGTLAAAATCSVAWANSLYYFSLFSLVHHFGLGASGRALLGSPLHAPTIHGPNIFKSLQLADAPIENGPIGRRIHCTQDPAA